MASKAKERNVGRNLLFITSVTHCRSDSPAIRRQHTQTPVSELSQAVFVCFVFFVLVSHVFIFVTCLSKTFLMQQHSSQFQYEEWFLVICIQSPMSSAETFV